MCEGKSVERPSKREKKMGTRFSDSVIGRLWSKNKGHHHIKNLWTLSKIMGGKVKGVTPRHETLTKVCGKLISRKSFELRRTRIIRINHPRYVKYFGNKLQNNNDTCSSKYSRKLRNRGIDSVYVEVELLYKHTRTFDGSFTQKFPTSSSKQIGQ